MKFGQPLLSTELSGSLGGVVGASARGGINYLRVRRRPSNPRSTAQSFVRTVLSGLAAAWVTVLTDAQRSAWAGIAPSGSSGIDAYIKGNAQIVIGGESSTPTAPVSLALSTDPFTAIAIDASADTLVFTNSFADADLRVNVYAQLTPQSPSQLSQNGGTTLIEGGVDLSVAGVNTVSLAAFPGLSGAAAGRIVYVRFVQYNVNGQVAQEQLVRVTIVA